MEKTAKTEDVLDELRKFEKILESGIAQNDPASKENILAELKTLNSRLLSKHSAGNEGNLMQESNDELSNGIIKMLMLVIDSAIYGFVGICIAIALGALVYLGLTDFLNDGPAAGKALLARMPAFIRSGMILGMLIRIFIELIRSRKKQDQRGTMV